MNEPTKAIYPCRVLTVVIRDDAPLVHCGDSPAFRSVAIEFTDEQIDRLKMSYSHSHQGKHFYEEVSKCFIEPVEKRPTSPTNLHS